MSSPSDRPEPSGRPAFSHQDFLIEGLMPAREFSLVAGSSGVGKTKLTIQLVMALEAGESFFGHPTKPSKCLYVACDRGRDSFKRSMDAYGLAYDAFAWVVERDAPALSTETLLSRPAQILEWTHRKHPGTKLVVLDGLSGLVKDVCDYQGVKAMVRQCQDRCESFDMAVLGTVHATKIRTLDKICNPRERVLGTVAWGGFSEMVISLDHEKPEDPQNPFRVVNLCNHSGASLRWRVVCDSQGRLVEVDAERDLLDILDGIVGQIPPEGLDRDQLETLASGIGEAVNRRTFYDWVARAIDSGILRRQGHTRDVRYFAAKPN